MRRYRNIILDLLSDRVARSDQPNIDSIALQAAREIEDIFAKGWPGGRTQRLARVQCVIIDAMKQVVSKPSAMVVVPSRVQGNVAPLE